MSGMPVSHRSVQLSILMKLVALIAVDLAFLRYQPYKLQSPPFLFALVAFDLIVIQYFVLDRRLGPFQYTFLIVGLIVAVTLNTFFDDGLFHVVTGTPTGNRKSPEGLVIADRFVTSALGPFLAWGAGLWVASPAMDGRLRAVERYRRLASFAQGAVIGFGVFTMILITINRLGLAPEMISPVQYASLLGLGLAICPLGGGTAVLLIHSRRDLD